MKKTLYSTTALAAAGLLTFGASDAFAQAAAPAAPEKLKMAIGGFFTAYAGVATNSTRTGSVGGTDSVNYNTFDIKNDSEISLKGSVALDNGMKVYLQIEFETDPSTAGGSSTATSTIGLDESYLGLDTNGFGDIRIGTQKFVTLTNGVSAPNVGGLNPSNSDTSLWVVRPSAGMTIASAFGQVSGADQNRINYLSPTIAGFRFAAGYTPSTTESDAQPVVGGTAGTETQVWDAALQYGFAISGMAFRTSVAYLSSTGQASSSSDQVTFGADVKVADFIVGGAWTHQWNGQSGEPVTAATNSNKLDSWNFGVVYAPGPFKVGYRTTQTYSDGARQISGQDKAMLHKVGGNYTIGPGVELTADIFHMTWKDEGSVAASQNKGYGVVGGIAVTF